jgi:hypothetical protein
MSKKLIVLLLLAATLLSAGAAVGAHPPDSDSAQAVRVHVAAATGDTQPPAPLGVAPALPAASGPVRFSADFGTADLSAWTGQPWLPGDEPAQWRVIKGRLQQDGNHAQQPTDEPAVLLGPDAGANFQYDAALLPEAGEPVGLVWHANDAGYNRVVFYAAPTAGTAATVRIEHVDTMGRVISATEAASTTWGGWTSRRWFQASVRVSGQTVSVLVDGQPVLTTQLPVGTGRVGVYSTAMGYAAFDNVRVQQPTTAMPAGPAGTIVPSAAPQLPAGPNAPDVESWSRQFNVSEGLGNSSGAGAISARSNGAVNVGWTWAEVGSYFSVKANHNDVLNGAFVGIDSLANQSTAGVLINFNQAKDRFDRVHMVWAHQYGNATADIWYARWENGVYTIKAPIPVAASSGNLRKNTGIAVDPTGRVHVVWGRDAESLLYTSSADGVHWDPPSVLPWGSGVLAIGVGVTTTGTPFVSWIDRSVDPDGDVHVAMRLPNNTWAVTDVSQGIGHYAHSPWLEGDLSGGMRVTWDDSPSSALGPEFDTPTERPPDDIYYREWNPATGWSPNVYQITNNNGDSLGPHMTIDGANIAHLVWNDPTNTNAFRVWYTRGSEGAGFISAYSLVPWTGDFYSKDADIDAGGPAVHVSYSIVFGGPNKDRYYIWSSATPPVPPTATPTNTATPTPRCPGQLLADVCPSDWFHPFVTDLVTQGAISGYTCGGPGEPCYPPGKNGSEGGRERVWLEV